MKYPALTAIFYCVINLILIYLGIKYLPEVFDNNLSFILNYLLTFILEIILLYKIILKLIFLIKEINNELIAIIDELFN